MYKSIKEVFCGIATGQVAYHQYSLKGRGIQESIVSEAAHVLLVVESRLEDCCFRFNKLSIPKHRAMPSKKMSPP